MDLRRLRLPLVWAAMAALTLAAIPIGHASDPRPLGVALTTVLIVVTAVKASLLLANYLELRHAPAWNRGLRAAVIALLALIGGLSLIARIG